MRNRRLNAFTITEVQIASLVSLMVLGLVGTSAKMVNAAWMRSNAENDAKDALHRVATRIAPTIRGALRIDKNLSTTEVITVVMPKTDVNGAIVQPFEEGTVYQFYFSDETGASNADGSILWRAKNGVAETAWSLRNGKGIVDLGSSMSITWEYTPVDDPGIVKLVTETTKTDGTKSVTKALHTQIHVRNHEFN